MKKEPDKNATIGVAKDDMNNFIHNHGALKQQIAAWLFALTAIFGLSACGQKGPLYFPQEQVPETSAAQKTVPAKTRDEPADEVESANGDNSDSNN